MSQPKEFILTFNQDVHYRHLDEDANSIFWAFNIPSWLHPSYKVRILNRVEMEDLKVVIFVVRLDSTPTETVPNNISLYFYEVFRDSNGQRLEYFVQQEEGPLLRKNRMVVQLNKFPERKVFTINIVDFQNFFVRKLQPVQDILYLTKDFNTLKTNMLEYSYIEPESIRFKKQLKYDHFHLAFQGGGAKGIAYIGAYKAIKIMLPNDKVTSVIGSSAGSMCALAIASNMSPDELIKLFEGMDEIPKDRTVKSAADLTPQIISNTERIKIRIRQFLHNYGLVPNTFCNYFSKSYLEDDEFVHMLLDYLLADNQSLRDMLSLPNPEAVYVNNGECCGPTAPYGFYEKEKLVNFYGLLQGNLMTGNKILEITDHIIKNVLDNAQRQNPFLFNKVFGNNARSVSTTELTKTVTLYQYYQFTGVELTCTGTDLDSQILRFFNQKTTPYLPVRMAVIMSASFPIAFEARRWKKEWGKYYLHHAQTRLQIDITGHQFSDGGILANLPVMYLDNEEMRPMIFSHMKTPTTKVYGFGLDEIVEPPSPELEKIKKQKKSALICKVIKQTPLCGICCYTCCCVPQNQYFNTLSIPPVSDIPPFAFLKKLIRTYRHANANLVMQIFKKDIYHFSCSFKLGKLLKFNITPELVVQYKNIRQSLVGLANKLKSMNNQQYGMFASFRMIRVRLPHLKSIDEVIQVKNIYKLILKLFIIFTLQEKTRMNYISERNLERKFKNQDDTLYEKLITIISSKIQMINLRLDEVGQEQHFVNVMDLKKHQKKLCDLSADLMFLDEILNDYRNIRVKDMLIRYFDSFFQYYREHFLDLIYGLLGDLDVKITDLEFALASGVKTLKNSKKIKEFQNFYDGFGYYELPEFIEFEKHFIALDQPFIKAKRIYREEEAAVIYYIEQRINRRTSPNIHLVLQGRGTVPQLNLEAFKTVREYLREMQSQEQQQTLNMMASLVINDYSNQTRKSFEISDLFILVVARADLTVKLQQNMRRFEELQEIDLQYIKYKVPPHLQKALIELRDNRKSKRCRITNVTTSGITTLLMLLTILGFQNEKIEDQINILGQYIYISPYRIQKKFQSYSWATPMRCRIRQLQQLIWEERFEIFTAMEMAIRDQKLPLNFAALREQFQQSREDVFQSFRQVLEYISQAEYKASIDKKPRETFSKKMSANIGTHDYYQINRDVSIATKAMVKNIVELFQNQIKLAIFTSGNIWINDIIEGFPDPNIHEWLWKGLIIENLLEIYLVKRQIKRILNEKNINPDIKLKDFYRIAPLKITLTFNAVDLATNQFVFINHLTHPELPLWMALTSAASLPLIFPKVVVRPVYLNKINPNEAERKLEILLAEGNEDHAKHLYTSGNLLDVLPLDLLTSYQTRKLYFDDKQFTFLSFGNENPEPEATPRTFLRKFPRFCDYMKLICTGLSTGFSVEPGRILTDKTALLKTYLNSHDNYIYQIYKGNLLRLPIRMGTLDFHKLGQGSSLAQETLFETQLSTFQKFSSTRRTYIQFQLSQNKLMVRMLSRDINNNDLLSKYRLQFKTLHFIKYQRLTKRAIEMDLETERELYMRFYFVENKEIVEREYCLDVMSLLDPYYKFKATYMIQYNKVLNTFVPPLTQPHKVSRYTVPEPPIDMLLIRSLVNIQVTGLYCQICSCQLAINKLYFTIPVTKSECYHCKQAKETRLVCTNKQRSCPGIYCMMCCSTFYYRKGEQLKCIYGHLMQFRNHRAYKLLSEQNIPFIRCSCCLQTAQDYYWDSECGTYVCLKCCSQFVDR